MKPVKSAILACGLIALSSAACAEITITDLRDRTVTLDAPAERVLLGFYYEDYLAVAGDGAVDKIVGLSRGPWAGWRPGQWEAYTQTFPQLANLPDVGDTESSTFSIEAALSTDPDLVILAGWQYDALGESVQQFDTAGIPVLVLDYNAQTLAAHLASTRALGQAMGAEDRAETLATLYAEMTADTAARVAASTEQPKVYVELAQKGPDEVGNSYAGGMWGGVIDRLNGRNIANGQIENWGPLSPEYVLAEAPEVILLSGSEWLNRPAAVPMGFGADKALAQVRIDAYMGRPGWSDLPAVQNGKVFGIYHGGSRTLSDFAYFRFLGKALHPEAFADVDPQAELTQFYVDWLPIKPEGTFVIQAE
ncbi:ABC transporter substrate-binding protein [Antarcticimicrobium luteum]|uniref:Iron ABC transporter substrate-binding protein n=1 Tax=Antarcticimicrobium luteum TaxID=2547397 RepID=A0A4R5UTB0_9RHOB|nr:ABC transporter substrate-binding protein [Antarcticimicrobium luteum]TDK42380.1 iron ABC transporter substrate-binding protein [Antarcticimicrobium luteum]